MTHPSSPNPSESLDMSEGDRTERDEAIRITTLMDNLNNLKSKLNNFTVMDELGQPIGEIQDLILDDTHQLNLVIALSGAAADNPSVLLNGRRIKKVSVQTHAVFVDIVKADVDFLPKYTPLESSDSRGDSFTNRADMSSSAPSSDDQEPLSYSEAVAAAAALMGGSAVISDSTLPSVEEAISPEDDLFTSDSLLAEPADDSTTLEDDSFASDPLFSEPADDFAALEDDLFISDPLFAEPADDFTALEDDLFASDPSLSEPADDFAALGEMSSMESLNSLDDDWFADDQDDLAMSLELPEQELSPLEDPSLESEPTSEFITTNNSLDDWSDLVSPTDQPGLDYALSSETSSLPELANNDLETLFSLAEADEISELGLGSELGFASWEQTSQPTDSLSSGLLDPSTDAEIESELEDLPDISSLANDFSVDALNEDLPDISSLANDFSVDALNEDLPDISSLANDFSVDALNEDAEEFLLPSDFGEAGSTTDFTFESLSDLDPPSEVSLDNFGFSDTAITEESLDDFGFSDTLTTDDALANPMTLDANFGESLGDDSDLSWTDEPTTDKLSELTLDDFNQPQTETADELGLELASSDLDLELAEELADLDLSATTSTDLEFETESSGLDLETEAISPLPDLDFSLGEDFLSVEQSEDLAFGQSEDVAFETEAISPLPDLDFSLDDDLLSVEQSEDVAFETEAISPLPDLDFSLDDDLSSVGQSEDMAFGQSEESAFEMEAIAPLPDLDFSLDDDSLNFAEQSSPIMDLSMGEIPTSFTEVPIDATSAIDSDEANLELDTAFDVDLSLEDEFGAENFAIAEPNDSEAFTLQNENTEPEPNIIASLTDLEFADALPEDRLPTDDLTNTFGSSADLSFAEEGEFADLTDLRSGFETSDFALDNLFDNPVENPQSASDEFNFSSPTMGFVDPAAGMAAASGILAGLAGRAALNRSSVPAEEPHPLDIADISDMSDDSAQEALPASDPAFSISEPEEIAPSPNVSIQPNSEPRLASLDEMVPLLEERLQVEYERRKVGEVIIRKKIETRMIQVPVRYEVLVIEQVGSEQKTLAEVDLSQGTFSEAEMPALAGKPTVSGEFKSAKTASAVIDAISKTLRQQCKSIRIEIELDDNSLVQSYQDWLDQCSDL
ncbi:DUF2382 domain-containing protein [Phormidium sp. CLA17]|uniref:YsnF/AvaK domain-containing protein n=1 Tax=Leptolyngbya sp. Cla-17 TaxID=2803751 RepID=UPI001491FDE4|nr:DUF2382 domain-containing protein [Leptolyngbya sp. Cla-17]MBM0740521.1 DUF2382 domain-containing protein [Leptolyngbya sp. Cla-17]